VSDEAVKWADCEALFSAAVKAAAELAGCKTRPSISLGCELPADMVRGLADLVGEGYREHWFTPEEGPPVMIVAFRGRLPNGVELHGQGTRPLTANDLPVAS
jgi:hypothetical protein